MSFAPRDTHEAQVQFALERGVPAMIGVLASERMPYPARAFDMAHCSRCLIPWFDYGKRSFYTTHLCVPFADFLIGKLVVPNNFMGIYIYICLFLQYRWTIFDRSGQSSEARRLLDSIWTTNQMEEILARVGEN